MKRIWKIVGKMGCALLLILVMVPLLVLSIPVFLVSHIVGSISLRRFCRREAGHVYLICTSRRGWHDFLKNNVIPILPDNFRVVWCKSMHAGEGMPLLRHLSHSHIFNVSKPYLVAVTRRALVHKSLNTVLQKLKAHPKKSEHTRQACAQIITQVLHELRSPASAARA